MTGPRETSLEGFSWRLGRTPGKLLARPVFESGSLNSCKARRRPQISWSFCVIATFGRSHLALLGRSQESVEVTPGHAQQAPGIDTPEGCQSMSVGFLSRQVGREGSRSCTDDYNSSYHKYIQVHCRNDPHVSLACSHPGLPDGPHFLWLWARFMEDDDTLNPLWV